MSRDLPWVFTCSRSRRALSGFFYSWHSIDRADNGRNSYIESSTQAEINDFGRLFLTVHSCSRSIPKVEANVFLNWVLVILIGVSVAVLIAHAIDAMRS